MRISTKALAAILGALAGLAALTAGLLMVALERACG